MHFTVVCWLWGLIKKQILKSLLNVSSFITILIETNKVTNITDLSCNAVNEIERGLIN